MKGKKEPSKKTLYGLPHIQPSPFNQTIIINNANININYIEPTILNSQPKNIVQATLYNKKSPRQGWNINEHLKQFNDTKHTKHKAEPIRSNISPYLLHKIKTQQMRNHIKNTAYNNLHSFREHRTISNKKETLSPIDERQRNNTQLKHKIRIKPRRPKQISKNISNLELYSNQTIDSEKTSNLKEKLDHISLRKKQFNFTKGKLIRNYESETTLLEKKSIENIEETLILQSGTPLKTQPKKKIIHTSIQKISNSLLKKQQSYLDELGSNDIPKSKIQFYTVTANQPSNSYSKASDYKSSQEDQECQGYDFEFDDQKKKKSRTPFKRKKKYEHS